METTMAITTIPTEGRLDGWVQEYSWGRTLSKKEQITTIGTSHIADIPLNTEARHKGTHTVWFHLHSTHPILLEARMAAGLWNRAVTRGRARREGRWGVEVRFCLSVQRLAMRASWLCEKPGALHVWYVLPGSYLLFIWFWHLWEYLEKFMEKWN